MTALFDAAATLSDAYRRVDWVRSPVGPVASWSPVLRSAVDTMLHTRSPVALMWGPEFTLLYNEAYVPMIGDKHPAALGRPSREAFPEIWDTIGPMLAGVAAGGKATWVEDLQLLMRRHGYLEETYFTFSYSAVHGPGGEIEGVLDIASETTAQVLGQRRLRLLSTLNDRLSDVRDLPGLIERALPVLRTDPDDLPGVEIRTPAGPGGGDTLEIVESAAGREARVRLSGDQAVLVTRLSAHLAVDDAYTGFLRLLGGALSQGLHRIAIRQAERRELLRDREMSEALQRSLLVPPVQPDNLEVAVRYQPSAEGAHIGGDWYDSFRLPDGRLTLVVGDVTGHDRYAAAAMSQIRNLVRGISYALLRPPARVLSALNDAMAGLRVDVLATAVLAQIDPGATEMRWANAGHPPPVLLAPDGTAHVLEAKSEVMLGTRARTRRSNHAVGLPPGTAVIFYTDGLIERRGTSFDTGLKELTETLRGRSGRTAEQLCDLLLAHFGDQAEDDVVLTVIRTRPPDD